MSNLNVEELKQRVETMRDCYFKGFGNAILGIQGKCEHYSNKPLIPEDRAKFILEDLEMIEEHYRKIPFSKLNSNSDFAPLFVIKDLLGRFGEDVREFLKYPAKGERVNRIKNIGTAICWSGVVYKDNILRRVEELRTLPGNEDFRVRITDYRGIEFMLA